jgi:hypothetical protein
MYLKEETKKNIEQMVGKSIEEMQQMTLGEEIAYVENRTTTKLQYPQNLDWRFESTGDPLISMGRYRTIEDVDRRLDSMFWLESKCEKLNRWMLSLLPKRLLSSIHKRITITSVANDNNNK